MGILDELDDLLSDDRPHHPTHAHGFSITFGDDLEEYLVIREPGAADFTVSCRNADGSLTPLTQVESGTPLSRYRPLEPDEVAWEITGDLFEGVTFVVERPSHPPLEFTLGDGM